MRLDECRTAVDQPGHVLAGGDHGGVFASHQRAERLLKGAFHHRALPDDQADVDQRSIELVLKYDGRQILVRI
jgi:hypothetical protein